MKANTILRMAKVAVTPRSRLLKTKLANGVVVYGRNQAGYGGRGIYVFQDAIEPEFQNLEAFLDATGVFVDVGASTGIYSLKAARHYGDQGTVLALEPHPEVAAVLAKNIAENGFRNIRLRRVCAGAESGVQSLWMNEGKPNQFSLVRRVDNAPSMQVEVVTLDELFKSESLTALDFMKVDVEGAERDVLLGASSLIEKYRPIIQVEVIMEPVHLELDDYAIFHAPNSPNQLCIPCEHARLPVPERLGWPRLS